MSTGAYNRENTISSNFGTPTYTPTAENRPSSYGVPQYPGTFVFWIGLNNIYSFETLAAHRQSTPKPRLFSAGSPTYVVYPMPLKNNSTMKLPRRFKTDNRNQSLHAIRN